MFKRCPSHVPICLRHNPWRQLHSHPQALPVPIGCPIQGRTPVSIVYPNYQTCFHYNMPHKPTFQAFPPDIGFTMAPDMLPSAGFSNTTSLPQPSNQHKKKLNEFPFIPPSLPYSSGLHQLVDAHLCPTTQMYACTVFTMVKKKRLIVIPFYHHILSHPFIGG